MEDRNDLELGAVFEGKYHLERLLGRGGFACVYLARQLPIDRPVALKLLDLHALRSPQARQRAERRFEREARVLAQLRTPWTPLLYDFGTTPQGECYIVSEFIDGVSLEELLEAEGAPSLEVALTVTRHVLSALDQAHALGIIHRDVKPSNIMLTEPPGEPLQAKLLDFGLVMMDASWEVTNLTGELILGTPRYMSPEQFETSEELRPTSDLYSLGLVLYELLTGECAHQGASLLEIVAQRSRLDLKLPAQFDFPDWLHVFTARLLSPEPSARFQSAQEALDFLNAHAPEHPTARLPAQRSERFAGDEPRASAHQSGAPWPRHVRAALMLGGLALALALIALLARSSGEQRPSAPVERSEVTSERPTTEPVWISAPAPAALAPSAQDLRERPETEPLAPQPPTREIKPARRNPKRAGSKHKARARARRRPSTAPKRDAAPKPPPKAPRPEIPSVLDVE